MPYVYILISKKNGKHYIGSTENIEKRIKKHKSGGVFFTKCILPIKLVFKQEFESIEVARKVEKKLKLLKRRDYVEKIISDGFIKLRG